MTTDREQFRAFLALSLNERVCKRLAGIQRQWRELWSPGAVSWLGESNFHLTLRFLGQIPSLGVEPIEQALGQLTANFSPIRLEAREIAVFPNLRRPAVLVLETSAPYELRRLVAEIDLALDHLGLGIEPRDKPFRAHITVGRVKGRAQGGLPKLTEPFSWSAREVVLFASHLSPQGARYEPLRAVPLIGGESSTPNPGPLSSDRLDG